MILSSVLAVLTVACIARTRDEIQYWRNDLTVWTRAIAVTKDNFMAHYKLGVILWSSPRQDLAPNELEEAVRIKPDFAPTQKFLAGVLFKLQRFSEAIDHYKRGLELAPDDAYHWYYCALSSYELGRLNDALVECRKSFAIVSNPSVQNRINQILELQAQAKQQNADLRAALEKNPSQAVLINNLAWFLATSLSEDERNGNEAVQLATRACELSNNYPVCVVTLAAAYAETGQYDEAIATADLARRLAEKAGDEQALKRSQELQGYLLARLPCYEMSLYNKLPTNP